MLTNCLTNYAIFTGFTSRKNTIVYVLTINMAFVVPALRFVFCVIQRKIDESKCTFLYSV